MKITFVLPHASLAGGIRVVAIYAEILRKRGHEVFVVSQPAKAVRRYERLKSLFLNETCNENLHTPSHLDPLFYVPHRILDSRRPVTDDDVPNADVVIATWWETAEWVASLSASKGAKAYFIQHHEASFEYLPKKRVEATYLLPLYKITISQWLIDLMKSKYNDNDVALVFNSVDVDQFYSPVRKRQKVPTIGMLYSPVYWKGCDLSIKAFYSVKERYPDLQLIAFGTDDVSPDVPLPEGSVYHRQPEQNRLKDIYSQCDLWLCGSRAEGFHLPPLEAMACRCPVVSTSVGGPADIIENGQNGYLAPVEDSATLAERMVTVLGLSNEEWQSMSNAAYKTALDYSWSDACELFEQALQQAVDKDKLKGSYLNDA